MQDVHRTCDDDADGDERGDALDAHEDLCAQGERHGVRGAEGRLVGERDLEIVAKARFPASRGIAVIAHLREQEVGEDRLPIFLRGNRAAAVELSIPDGKEQ